MALAVEAPISRFLVVEPLGGGLGRWVLRICLPQGLGLFLAHPLFLVFDFAAPCQSAYELEFETVFGRFGGDCKGQGSNLD